MNPVIDLNMTDVNPQMTKIDRVAPLPDGGAFFFNYVRTNSTKQVLRVNIRGEVIQHVHQCVRCDYIGGLLLLNNDLYVIYRNGTIEEVNINNTNKVQVYQVPSVSFMTHTGSLSYHPSVITHPDVLLLAAYHKGEIFSYNVTSKNKQVHLTGLYHPSSVSFMIYNSHLYYVVCVQYLHQVRVYSSTWGLYKTLGGAWGFHTLQVGTSWRSGDGQLYYPHSAIGLPDGSVIISDDYNHRISLFTIQGKFVRHILTRSDGLSHPKAMSISLPYLWVVDNNGSYRYRLY